MVVVSSAFTTILAQHFRCREVGADAQFWLDSFPYLIWTEQYFQAIKRVVKLSYQSLSHAWLVQTLMT